MYNQMFDEFENGCKDYRDMKPGFIADGGNVLLGIRLHIKEKNIYI